MSLRLANRVAKLSLWSTGRFLSRTRCWIGSWYNHGTVTFLWVRRLWLVGFGGQAIASAGWSSCPCRRSDALAGLSKISPWLVDLVAKLRLSSHSVSPFRRQGHHLGGSVVIRGYRLGWWTAVSNYCLGSRGWPPRLLSRLIGRSLSRSLFLGSLGQAMV